MNEPAADIIEVKPRSNYRLWLRYSDGVEGEVDLSDLAGRGVFAAWQETGVFESVKIGTAGELIWREEIDLCPDALYLRLTGKQPADVFPLLAGAAKNA